MPAIPPSAPSPAASALAAASGSSSPASSANASAQPGDFNSQLDAATEPTAPAAAPVPSSPAQPAPAASDPGAGEPVEGDDADQPAASDAPADLSTAVLEGMAALLASLAAVPLPPAPAPAPALPAGSGTEATDAATEGGGDASSAPATSSSGSVDLAAPLLSTPALGSGSSAALPLALASASQPTLSKAENNTATLPKEGNNVPSTSTVTTQAAPVIDDKSGQNGQKSGSDDSDAKKSPQNDPLAAAFPAPTAVSGQLGTLYSELGAMPAMMEKTAASAPTANDAAQAMSAALAAIAPTKVGTTFSVASFLRGYPVSPSRDRGASDPAASPVTPAVAPSLSLSQNTASITVPETTVTLDSNVQFVDVIRQALDDRPMVAPQRIAIELQTPPGATVTVFFSQANGQLRAQLSASDSGSLQWLQQQVGNLRDGGGTASTVVWLPPQLDQQQGGDSSSQQQRQQQPRHAAAPSAEDMALAETIFGGAEAGMEAARN